MSKLRLLSLFYNKSDVTSVEPRLSHQFGCHVESIYIKYVYAFISFYSQEMLKYVENSRKFGVEMRILGYFRFLILAGYQANHAWEAEQRG